MKGEGGIRTGAEGKNKKSAPQKIEGEKETNRTFSGVPIKGRPGKKYEKTKVSKIKSLVRCTKGRT